MAVHAYVWSRVVPTLPLPPRGCIGGLHGPHDGGCPRPLRLCRQPPRDGRRRECPDKGIRK